MSNGPNSSGIWPSPFNELAQRRTPVAGRVFISDCTLRDGEQQAGIAFDKSAKVEIARALDRLGVYEIEAGTPASSEEDRDAVVEICRLGLTSKISCLVRAIPGDIDQAASLGVWGVRISFPISPLERKHKLKGISNEDYLKKALDITAYARNKGLYVVFSPYDTTRADLPFLKTLVAELERAGTVDRLRIVDTTGCALPEAVAYLIGQIKESAPKLALEIHCHNDFGLACANTVAGVIAGADYISGTINGLGERSGNAALEEVCMTLEALYEIKTGLDLTRLMEASRVVSKLSGVSPQPNKAVVGENAFRHESGMVVAGLLQDPYTAESYAPELVGQKRQILIGKKSGIVSISLKVREMGLEVPEDRFPELLARVKEAAVRKHWALADEEFAALAKEMMHG
jgi:isopropylmalate/homocitrate/citramalate synthase